MDEAKTAKHDGLVLLLTRLAISRPRRVLVLGTILFVVSGVLGASVASRLDPYGADDPASEAVQAREQLEAVGLDEPQVLVVIRDAPLANRATQARVWKLERRLRALPEVRSVRGYFDTGLRAFVAKDLDSTYLVVVLRPGNNREIQDAGSAVATSLAGEPDLLVGGLAVTQQEVNERLESDLRKAEVLASPLLFLLSLLFFRSLVAALLPLLIGTLAIFGTFLILRIASELTSVSIFALTATTALGLGLAIDYSLLIVSRYREELARHGPGALAMQATMSTAGRTVCYSALTVAAAFASLFVFPQRFLYSTGIGGTAVALLAALVSLTVLPAMLILLGRRVDALAPAFLQRRAKVDARPTEQGFWYRLSRFVMRFPLRIATLSALLLIVLGIPFLGIRFNAVDPTVLPADSSPRLVYETLATEFPPYQDSPIWIAVERGTLRGLNHFAARIGRVQGVAAVEPPQRLRGDVSAIRAVTPFAYYSSGSRRVVERVRALPPPPGASFRVTGAGASFVDFQESLYRHLPVSLGLLAATTMFLLFLFTGSVVLPVKALIMNLLTLSAVFGILVLVFQDGRLEGLLAYDSTGAIDQSMPILLFATAFGLSTDYAVFLLSRIKEARDGGASEAECVAIGLERTGRIVTAGALLFAVVACAFAMSGIVVLKANGIGTALAVLIDAFIVRTLLVPSLMTVLGRWNWWAPAPLRRFHERIGIHESEAASSRCH